MENNYFRLTPEQALEQLQSSPEGLSLEQAEKRLKSYGLNKLTEGKKKSVFLIFLEQFKDLLVIILTAAAAISMASGNLESTIVIFAVLILNAVLGTVQSVKAEKSLESLKAMSSPMTKVLRNGTKITIPSVQLVPGDVITLEAGDLVPADGRILENYSLKVNESALTGESENVEKIQQVVTSEKVALGDQKNMVFSGSLISYGRASVLITGTGMNTQLGKIAALMNETGQRKTPLQKNLDEFSKKLAAVILIICAIVFILSVLRSHMSVLDSLMFAVALAVAAIPEALSSIVTIVLAIGTQKMAKQNAIMKELKAVESLGAVSIVCSDKTGTLTQNKMQAQKIYADKTLSDHHTLNFSNSASKALLTSAVLASDAIYHQETDTGIGDPTEIALVRLAQDFGIDETVYRRQYPRLKEIAFDSDRKLMSTLQVFDTKPVLMIKGAIDVLLERCTKVYTSHGILPLDQNGREELLSVNHQLSSRGLRVLAFGFRELDTVRDLTLEDEQEITFIGLISMMDPPRPESAQAVTDAKNGGIKTVMITGDHEVTAAAIARQIGILSDGDITLRGIDLDQMTDDELDAQLEQISVYARVSPEHKIRIVSAWQRKGCIVSMTGDGVNDAPALKRADVGVAMGITGTDVSKDAASMILSDDNFATIIKAVLNGRNIYTNIKNAIQFLLSGNMAAILSVIFASVMALPAPFAPVHLLFINLLTDSLPAIAIGMEPARPGLLKQKPRDPNASILDKAMLTGIFVQGFFIAVPTMTAFYIGYQNHNAALASTMAFSTLTLARLFHGFNCRGSESIFRLKFSSNPYSILAFLGGTALLACVLLIPALSRLFQSAHLSLFHLGMITLLAFLPTLIIQIIKAVKNNR